MPVCNTDGRLAGVVTDRDLAVKFVAEGRDPATVRLGELLDSDEVVTIGDLVDAISSTPDNG